MTKRPFLLSTAFVALMGLGFLTPAFADGFPADYDFETSQGDGDPNEAVFDDSAFSDENVATITADGDLLVPSYLLPTQQENQSQQAVVVVSDPRGFENIDQNPVIVTPPAQIITTTRTVETIQTPTPVLAPVTPAYTETTVHPTPTQPTTPAVTGTITRSTPLLLPLPPIADGQSDDATDVKLKERRVYPSAFADQMLNTLENNKATPFIMPHELKVTFYPNATALSGQTLKWIKSFALQTIQDPRMMVEIRLSRLDPGAQAKRLAVIHNSLMSTGLSAHQLQITYTDRPVDSLVLRAIEKPQKMILMTQKSSSGKTVQKKALPW